MASVAAFALMCDGAALLMTIAPLRDVSGEVSHIVAIKQDISLRKQTAAQLAQARDVAVDSTRLKSEFLANMSHEIRTPHECHHGNDQPAFGYAELQEILKNPKHEEYEHYRDWVGPGFDLATFDLKEVKATLKRIKT